MGTALDEYWANQRERLSESPLLEDVLDLVHPEAEWKTPVMRGSARGPEAWLAAIEDGFEAVDYWRPRVEELIDAGGDQVLAVLQVSIRGKGSGAAVAQQIFSVVRVRDGRIAGITEYTDRREALEAAGLPE